MNTSYFDEDEDEDEDAMRCVGHFSLFTSAIAHRHRHRNLQLHTTLHRICRNALAISANDLSTVLDFTDLRLGVLLLLTCVETSFGARSTKLLQGQVKGTGTGQGFARFGHQGGSKADPS